MITTGYIDKKQTVLNCNIDAGGANNLIWPLKIIL